VSVRIVCMVHGSRDPRWRVTVEGLGAELRRRVGDGAVRLAHMELGSPTLAEVAREAVHHGVTKVVVLPLFIAAGTHVDNDIAAQAAAARQAFPELSLEVVRPLGEEPGFVDLVARQLRELVLRAERS
jgi:sirohydrochlorin cobaltochelatase